MTKYGIHLGKINSDPTALLQTIKDTGFDSVLVSLEGSFPHVEFANIVRSVGLDIDNSHAPWTDINHFWKDNEKGIGAYEMLKNHLIKCSECGIPRVVWHVSAGNGYPPISQLGIDRTASLVELAEKLGIDICLENQRFFHFIDYIYAKIDSERLKFCYDSGHEACFSQTKLCLPKYRGRLAALHLHDNSGIYNDDSHLMPGEGTGVDWDYVRKYLADYDGVISLELKADPSMTREEYYAKALRCAKFVK